MTNSNFPPHGIEPWLWQKIRAKQQRALTAELRTIWQTDHILWAVVKGANNFPDLQAQWPTWSTETIQRKLNHSLQANHIKIWGKRYLPTNPRHQTLKRRLSHR